MINPLDHITHRWLYTSLRLGIQIDVHSVEDITIYVFTLNLFFVSIILSNAKMIKG